MASLGYDELTPKCLEMHGSILSTAATDALVLKHQAISGHSADSIFTVLDQFHTKLLHFIIVNIRKYKIIFW